jgi:hypothetical protein
MHGLVPVGSGGGRHTRQAPYARGKGPAEMGDRPVLRAPADGAGAVEPNVSGPGAAAAAERPAAGPTGLVDALHGAPDLLAEVRAFVGPWVDRPSPALRRVSKACCEAVDSTSTRIRLDFYLARQQADAAGDAAWLARMERRLAKLPFLSALACWKPSDVELGQLLAGPTAAQRLQHLDVRRCTSGRSSPGGAGPQPAHLPSLQVRVEG